LRLSLGADHHKDISRQERTLVVVHLDADKAHIIDDEDDDDEVLAF
jgi:hypothetical protein